MLVKTPQIVLERYSKLAIKNGSKKVKVLANLPKRTEDERKVIRRVLSNAHCRACGSCCNQRIHIGRRDPNFKAFMREVSKREKEFRLTSEGKNGKKVYILESKTRGDCPFLIGEGDPYSIPDELLPEGRFGVSEKAPFGCGVYKCRPSICTTYPLYVEYLSASIEPNADAARVVLLASECDAIWELMINGIGHLEKGEIEGFRSDSQNSWGTMLYSLYDSLTETQNRMKRAPGWGRFMENEEGEVVIPINSFGVVPGV